MAAPAGLVVSAVVLRRAAAQPTMKNQFCVFAETLCQDANLDAKQTVTVALLRALCQVPRENRPALRAMVRDQVVKDGHDLLALVKNFVANQESDLP